MLSRRARIRLTKAALLLTVLALCVVGRRGAGWPLILWKMYSTRSEQFPASTVQSVQVRAREASGEQHVLYPGDYLGPEQLWFARVIADYGFSSDNQRNSELFQAYLRHAVSRALGSDEVEQIAVWRVTWAVEPLAVPPLDVDRPSKEVLVGTLPSRTGDGVR